MEASEWKIVLDTTQMEFTCNVRVPEDLATAMNSSALNTLASALLRENQEAS